MAALAVCGAVAATLLLWQRGDEQELRGKILKIREENFTGKPGDGHVAVVSCPGAADLWGGYFSAGEMFFELTRWKDLAVSVVFVKDASMPEFWGYYKGALRNYATSKRFIVVLTKQSGAIGHVQREEVHYLEHCSLFDRGSTYLVALTFREFKFWARLGFVESALGQRVPWANWHVRRLPTLWEMERRFRHLPRLAEPVRVVGRTLPSVGDAADAEAADAEVEEEKAVEEEETDLEDPLHQPL